MLKHSPRSVASPIKLPSSNAAPSSDESSLLSKATAVLSSDESSALLSKATPPSDESSAPLSKATPPSDESPSPGVFARARSLAAKYRDVAVFALATPIAVFLVLDYAILPAVLTSEQQHAQLISSVSQATNSELSAAASLIRFVANRVRVRVDGRDTSPPKPADPLTVTPVSANASLLLNENVFCPTNASEHRFLLSVDNRSDTQTLLIACPTQRRTTFCQLTSGLYVDCPSEFNTSYEELAQLRTSMRACRLNCRQTNKPYYEDVFVRCYYLYHRNAVHVCLDKKTNIIISMIYDHLQMNEAEVGRLYFVVFDEVLNT